MIDAFSTCRLLSAYSPRLILPLLRSSSSVPICRSALYSYPPPVPRAPTAAPPQNEGLQPHCTKPAIVNSRYNVFFMAHPPSFWLRAIFVPEDFVGEALFSKVSIVPFPLHWISEIPSVEHARGWR